MQKENKKIVVVKSLTLLKKLCEAKCLSNMVCIGIDRDDEENRPVYLFADSDKVSKVRNEFLKKYKADDRSMDNEWDSYDPDRFVYCKYNPKVKTRNFKIVEDAFESGLILDLRYVGKDERGKITFTFLKSDKIDKIKTKRDAESHELYIRKMEDNINA